MRIWYIYSHVFIDGFQANETIDNFKIKPLFMIFRKVNFTHLNY